MGDELKIEKLEQPVTELTLEEAQQVQGGFNPQPEPPGRTSYQYTTDDTDSLSQKVNDLRQTKKTFGGIGR